VGSLTARAAGDDPAGPAGPAGAAAVVAAVRTGQQAAAAALGAARRAVDRAVGTDRGVAGRAGAGLVGGTGSAAPAAAGLVPVLEGDVGAGRVVGPQHLLHDQEVIGQAARLPGPAQGTGGVSLAELVIRDVGMRRVLPGGGPVRLLRQHPAGVVPTGPGPVPDQGERTQVVPLEHDPLRHDGERSRLPLERHLVELGFEGEQLEVHVPGGGPLGGLRVGDQPGGRRPQVVLEPAEPQLQRLADRGCGGPPAAVLGALPLGVQPFDLRPRGAREPQRVGPCGRGRERGGDPLGGPPERGTIGTHAGWLLTRGGGRGWPPLRS
jgi:hypothetical protein